MHTMTLLHKTFEKELPFIHKIRLNNVMESSSTLIKSNKLTLTLLGRNISNKFKTRSNIKKIDRLLSNSHLHKDTIAFYKAMNSYIIQTSTQPWIHVDWSCICSSTNLYLLRASLSMQGRSIVIYEECHSKKKENNHATHKAFLNNLKALLPESVKPIIVTDAGFRAPWFQYIRHIGWDFVGRLRHKNAIRCDGDLTWQLSGELYSQASGKPMDLGHGVLTKKNQVACRFVLYKGKPKRRHKLNQNKSRSRSGLSKRHAKAHKEPWLLVTSLDTTDIAKIAVNIYRQRMRIEENFRDTKCTRYGFGLKESLTKSAQRMKVLLLIAAIASFACWLAGIVTKMKKSEADFQAHSSKNTGVLSIVYLGCEALKKGLRIGYKQFQKAVILLFEINIAAQMETACYE